MGMSHQPDKPTEPAIEVDRSGFMDPEVQRGFPIADQHGFPGGASMKGTRPGVDGLGGLDDAGTVILRGMLKKARGRQPLPSEKQ
jgi:hypothetical protein